MCFIHYSRTQKGYKWFGLVHYKFYFADVTFKSLSYFAPSTSPITQSMPSSENLEKEIIPKSLQVFTRCPKNVVSTSLPTDSESTVIDPGLPNSISLPTAPLLSTVETDTSVSLDFDFPIVH